MTATPRMPSLDSRRCPSPLPAGRTRVVLFLGSATAAALVVAASVAGCAVDATPSGEPIGTASSDLLGAVNYDAGGCSYAQQVVIDRVASFGRIAAESNAFKQCVTQAMATATSAPPYAVGPYILCSGDPGVGASVASQTAAVLATSLSPNGLDIGCDNGTNGNASAGQDNPGTLGNAAETFTFHSWFQNNWNYPEQSSGWPYSQMAGTMWHEAFHQEGYHHGANEQSGSAAACGVTGPNAATFNFQVNTVNYIVGGCMESVIDTSGTTCGLHNAACPNGLMMTAGFGSNSCVCVNDPTPPVVNAPQCFFSAQANGTVDVHCNADSAGDPVYIYSLAANGSWTYVYDYPVPSYVNGGWAMQSGLAAGTSETLLGCTITAAESAEPNWASQIGPRQLSCDTIATPITIPACVPLTTASCSASECGQTLSNACSTVTCAACPCVPTTCEAAGQTCGTLDTCGTPVACGTCSTGEACSSGHCCLSGETWNGSTCAPPIKQPPPPKCGKLAC